ncbi:hypothetical protein [uncultured Roseobacter sp.]|uniref:hypothetical protein n=1 Tax=uncultured Roseobacter sp. TaxID=114847 RepID=UPI00261216D4|nr:hypothetical protein [uncultured Roseobacter sp.]
MSRNLRFLPALSVLALGACATVAEERLSSIVVDDESYVLRTRVIETENGSFETTSARVRGKYFICKIDSPGDCEAAVRRGKESNIFDRD